MDGRLLPIRRSRRAPGRRAVALALALTVLGGGGSVVAVEHVRAAEHRVAQDAAAAAARAEALRQVRVADAATARLTAAAVGYSAMRRTQALDAARAAVVAADAVVVDAAVDLPADAVTPLGQAVADLSALIDVTPTVPAVTTPFDPAVLRASDTAPAAPSSLRSAPRAHRSGVPRVDAPAATAVPATAVPATAVPATAVPATAVPATAVPATAVPATAAEPATAAAEAAATAVVPPVPDAVVPDAVVPDAPVDAQPVPAPATLVVRQQQLAALDLGASAEVVAAARRVAELTVQVQAAADAAAAEAAAQAAAREAAERAAREAAEELARRVAEADAAPNGRIPLDVLCGVELADDVLLRCDAALALDALAAAYREDHGRDLVVSSSYRSFDAQVAVKAAKGGLAATPGRSNHGRALAVDLAGFGGVGEFGDPDYLWMKAHAAQFGWLHPAAMEPGGSGPLEPWHWEFDTEDP